MHPTWKCWKAWREVSIEWGHVYSPIRTCIMTTLLLRSQWLLGAKRHFKAPTLQSRSSSGGPFPVPRVKTAFIRHHHGTVADVKEVCTSCLKDFPETDFQGAFKAWTTCWQKRADAQGPYFEELQLFVAIYSILIFFELCLITFIRTLYISNKNMILWTKPIIFPLLVEYL